MLRNTLTVWLALVLVSLALVSAGCASGPADLPGTPVASAPKFENTPEPPKQYKVGEAGQFGDHTVTVNKVEKADGIVTVNLSIANSGSGELVISSQTQFVARDGEDSRGKLLSDEDGSRGYWKLKAGEKLQDNLKFKFPATAKGLKLYYTKTTLITTGRADQPAIFVLE